MGRKKYFPIVVFLGIIVFFQLLFLVTGTNYFLKEMTQSAYYTLVVLGLCLLMGYAGQISLGHAGFFAVGGYTSAVLTTYDLSAHAAEPAARFLRTIGVLIARQDIYGQDLLVFSPWIAFILAIIISVLIALLIGIPVIRLKGHYLAMATLGFGLIIEAIVKAARIFGQYDPITGVPPFRILLGIQVNGRQPFRIMNYYLAWIIVIIIVVLIINIINSRAGRALRSIHSNEQAAGSLGINSSKYKLYTFVFSAVLAAISGVFLTHYNASIGPTEITTMKSVRYVAIVAVGGMANIWGNIFMSVLLNFLSLRGYFGVFDDLVFGTILIAVMLFAPDGLLQPAKIVLVKDRALRLIKRRKNADIT
ncbi:MAG: branched-chain amino acid ABC transporter permease [Spirochaetales bacterium]|nr:branched-chain amino acid ABC transporter permease [Spirochaetales bacterium]